VNKHKIETMGFISLGSDSRSPSTARSHGYTDSLRRAANSNHVSLSYNDGEMNATGHTTGACTETGPRELDTLQTHDLEEEPHRDIQEPVVAGSAKCLECNRQCYAFLGIAAAVLLLVDAIILESLWYLLGSIISLLVAIMFMYESAESYLHRIHICLGHCCGRDNAHRDDELINDDSVDQMEQGMPLLTSPNSTDTLSASVQDMDASYSSDIVTVDEARNRIQRIWAEVEACNEEGGFFNRSVAKVPGIADGSVELYKGLTHAGFSTFCNAVSYSPRSLGFTEEFMLGVLQRQMTDAKEYKTSVIHWFSPDSNVTSFSFGKHGCFSVKEDHNTFLTVRL